MAQPPRPIFVIGDVHSSSYTTAIGVLLPKSTEEGEDEPVLLCGTNDGSINLWSLSTYRLVHHYGAKEVASLLALRQYDLSRVSYISALPDTAGNGRRLLCQIKSNAVYSLSFEKDHQQLLHKWTTFATSFAKCFPLAENCFAFLSETQSDVIQLVNTERGGKVCDIKLVCEMAETSDSKENDHGVVMALYLFRKDVAALPGMDIAERQALFLLVAYEDGVIALHRTPLSKPLERIMRQTAIQQTLEAMQMSLVRPHQEMVTCMDFHEGTMRGVSCSVDTEIALWDVNIPETILSGDAHLRTATQAKIEDLMRSNKLGVVERKSKRITLTNGGVLCCCIRPDGKLFATGGKDGRVRMFSLRSGKPLVILAFHSDTIEALRFVRIPNSNPESEDSTDTKPQYHLFASSRDRSISVWSLYND